MRFPKSSNIILCFYLTLFGWFSYGQGQLLKLNDSTQQCTFDTYRLNQLVRNDSLYEAVTLLNEAITFSEEYNLKSTQAKAYYSLGTVLTKMSNYKQAEDYNKKAFDLYSDLEDNSGKNKVLSGLANTYLKYKNYKKFDSIYPIAQKLSKTLKSELYFVNLELITKKYYLTRQNKALLNVTNSAIDTLNSIVFDKRDVGNKLLQSFSFYNAIANIKAADFDAEGFNLLFKLNENNLKDAFKNDFDSYRKLATFNYYKYLYYNEANINLDSANKYLLKSDAHKYTALTDYESRNARNGELTYKIVNAEQQLNLVNEIRKKDAKASQIFLITTILTSILLLATLVMLYFYFKAKKNIQAINKELKATNEKLLNTDKERLEFFSILSHELRTPIYGISGLATLVNQEKDRNKAQSYLDSLISSSNYLSILVDNILQANKLRFEDNSLRLKPDKIVSVVNHVVSTVKIAARNKGIKLNTFIDASDDNELILIDKVAFSQILINLAYNAIRYTKEGEITINVIQKARTEKDVTLRFEVNDTGIGIKEEHRSIVFSAFENKMFLHKNSSGSGLGLYIVKTLLKSHNSDIDFISEPNKGSSFFFEITFDIVISLDAIKSIANAKSYKRKMHILIVDDNQINLLITKKNIENIGGLTCEIISKGREAISMAKAKAFDLILMDINMPDMDGFEATEHIRMFNTTVPIIALTALNSGEILKKAEDAGINQIITKPFLFEDFKNVILSYSKKDHHYKQMDLETIKAPVQAF